MERGEVDTQSSTNSIVRQFDATTFTPKPSFFISDFMNYFAQYTDAPLLFAYGIALMTLGQYLGGSLVNLTPPWRHNLFLFLIGKSAESRKTTALGTLGKLGISTIPFGSREATIQYLAATGNSGVLIIDECSGFLKMCQHPTYLLGMTEFYNRLYDGTRLEHNTRRDGLIVVNNHYVGAIMATTQEGFSSSVDEEILYNGFMNRFLTLVGEGNPKPRRVVVDLSISILEKLKEKIGLVKNLKVSFKHSEETALLAHDSLREFGEMDSRLLARVEEHVLQVSDILALDRHLGVNAVEDQDTIEVAVVIGDVALARRFIVEVMEGFRDLLKTTSMPPGALREVYQIIHRFHIRGVKKFTKSQVLKNTNKFRARDIGEALYTAVEAKYLKVKKKKIKGEEYTIREDPMGTDRHRTVESSNLSNIAREKGIVQQVELENPKTNGGTVESSNLPKDREQVDDNDLGRAKPQTCPYGKECGYEGVFMWTRLFDEHMAQCHPSKGVGTHKVVT